MSGLLLALLALLAFLCLASVGYLLTLLAAALTRRPAAAAPSASSTNPRRIAVVIPAHNEEAVLAQTLQSLKAQDYPSDRFEVVVIADNCTDTTAQIACQEGATVLERHNIDCRGKGHALAWAFGTLLAPHSPLEIDTDERIEAFAIVDADTWVAPDFLSAMARRLPESPETRSALQGRYGVLNPGSGWRAALMRAAFELVNHVKPLGNDRLGLPVGLKGNGMVFTRATLVSTPWTGRSITEDIDYGLDLLAQHGLRVQYAPEALVLAQMPVTGAQGASQRARWEGGRYRLVRERVPRLLAAALRQRDPRLLAAAYELLIPPLAELVGMILLWGAVLALASPHLGPEPRRIALSLFVAAVVGLCTYVLVGMRAAGAGREAYLALLRAPLYIFWKFALYGRALLTGRRSRQSASNVDAWVRTERIPLRTDEADPIQGVHR